MTAVVPVSDSTLRENPQTYFIHYKSCCDDTHLMSKKHCQQAAFNKKRDRFMHVDSQGLQKNTISIDHSEY